MSISINVNAKTDYSYLFSSLSTSSSSSSSLSSLTSLLGDYASIKSGSYGKLMKAYYSGDSSSEVGSLAKSSTSSTSSLTTSETAKKLNKVQTATDSLKDSADALLESGSESLFAQKEITTTDENGLESTTTGYDTDAIYSAVNKFVKNYNSVINTVDDAGNDTVTNRGVSMANITAYNENSLNKIGITVNDDETLSLDKETFMKADMSSVKSLFNGNGSYGYQVSAQASLINYAADYAASQTSIYTGTGTYSSTLSTGNVYSSYF